MEYIISLRSGILTCVFLVVAFSSCKMLDRPSCNNISGTSQLANEIGGLNISTSTFPNTDLIKLEDYSYNQNGRNYNIIMPKTLSVIDVCTFLNGVTLHSNSPKFIVPSLPSKLVAVCISTNLLKLRPDNKSISNIHDIVWTWNSGLKSGVVSSGKLEIEYKDGNMVIDGTRDSVATIMPLTSGQLYYFSMWSWDDEGKSIKSSSANVPFLVDTRYYQFSSYNFLSTVDISYYSYLASWQLSSAVDPKTNLILPNTGIPLKLDFRFDIDACQANDNYFLQYIENGAIRNIKATGNFISIENSVIFQDKIEILFVCETELIFKAVINNKEVLLKYRR